MVSDVRPIIAVIKSGRRLKYLFDLKFNGRYFHSYGPNDSQGDTLGYLLKFHFTPDAWRCIAVPIRIYARLGRGGSGWA